MPGVREEKLLVGSQKENKLPGSTLPRNFGGLGTTAPAVFELRWNFFHSPVENIYLIIFTYYLHSLFY
jgi:hypothetical protein